MTKKIFATVAATVAAAILVAPVAQGKNIAPTPKPIVHPPIDCPLSGCYGTA